MAFELAIYDDERKIIAHRSLCKTVSSVSRVYQTGHIIRVTPGWHVVCCQVCKPSVFVEHVTVGRLRGNAWLGHPGAMPRFRGPEPEPEPEVPAPAPAEDEPVDGAIAGPEPLGPTPAQPVDGAVGGAVDGAVPARRWSPEHYYDRRLIETSTERSWPPLGPTALDITHSPQRKNWIELAACRDKGRLGRWLQWLFLHEHEKQWTLTVQKVVCSECPVRAECLEQGVWGGEPFGIWGGATRRERLKLKRKWEAEGRVDERPQRVNAARDYRSGGTVRSEDGGRDTTPRRDDRVRDDEASRAREAASLDMLEVWPEGLMPEPRTVGAQWYSEGIGDW